MSESFARFLIRHLRISNVFRNFSNVRNSIRTFKKKFDLNVYKMNFEEEFVAESETRQDDKTSKKKQKEKEWSDEEVTSLIDMYDENPCLCDIHHSTYHKRDLKELAWTEIMDTFKETTLALIKSKINNLRSQLSREISKERKTDSGQSFDELYKSTWVHFDDLKFLIPVLKVKPSRNTMKNKRAATDDETDGEASSASTTGPPKKKTIAERKLDLLLKCTDAITSKSNHGDSPAPKVSSFSLYVDERLRELDPRSRRIAEKRITEILFEAEMQQTTSRDFSVPTLTPGPVPSTPIGFTPNSFMDFMQQGMPMNTHQMVPNLNASIQPNSK